MRKWIAALAALGVLSVSFPLEAQTRQVSPVYAGLKDSKGYKSPTATKAKAKKKPSKPRTAGQKAAQKKATKAAAAKMKRSGPTQKQKSAQKKATKAAAAKAKATPNKRRA